MLRDHGNRKPKDVWGNKALGNSLLNLTQLAKCRCACAFVLWVEVKNNACDFQGSMCTPLVRTIAECLFIKVKLTLPKAGFQI